MGRSGSSEADRCLSLHRVSERAWSSRRSVSGEGGPEPPLTGLDQKERPHDLASDGCLAPTAPEHGWARWAARSRGPDASTHGVHTHRPPASPAMTETTPHARSTPAHSVSAQ